VFALQKKTMSQADIFLCGGIIILIGWLVIPRISNRLTADRERQRNMETREHAAADAKATRNREFLVFMEKWKAQFDGFNFCVGGRGVHYQNTLPDFLAEARKIDGDFTDSVRQDAFKAGRDRLATLTPNAIEEAYDNKGKKLVLKAIQDVIDAV